MLFNKKPLAKFTRIDEDELQQLKKRTDIGTIIIIIFIALLVSRLWFLQIHKGPEYQDLAENNRVRILDIIAPRGNLADRHGRIIVTNRPSYNIVWTKEDATFSFEVEANAFLYHMVRRMVSLQVAVGQGLKDIGLIEERLRNPQTVIQGLAPAQGLCLIDRKSVV